MKKILTILFFIPFCAMAQFGVALGGPIGGSLMNGFSQMEEVNPVTWSVETHEIDASNVEISLHCLF